MAAIIRTAILAIAMGLLAGLGGCSGGDDGPAGPVLGEEVDLSLYGPAGWEDYYVTYQATTQADTAQSSVWYHGAEIVYDTDPDTGEQIEISVRVMQEEVDYIFQDLGDTRTYTDGRYVYGIKVYGGGTWEPLYSMRPKMKVAPDNNPRINEGFDIGGSSLVFADEEWMQVIWLRSWTTYLAVLDSLTVPAGTFHDVLKTRSRQRVAYKVVSVVDTTVLYNPAAVGSYEGTGESWDAPGIGTIRQTAGSGEDFAERVLISGTVDGVTYPTKSDGMGTLSRPAVARDRSLACFMHKFSGPALYVPAGPESR